MSTLMFWNKQNGNANQTTENGGGGGGKTGKKTWLHAPDALLNGHVAYLVKVSGFPLNFFYFFYFFYNYLLLNIIPNIPIEV